MTTDLWMLVWSAVLCLTLPVAYGTGRGMVSGGMAWGIGNRDRPLEGVAPWAARAHRAHLNLIENLAPFAILVLVAQLGGKANATTALGATIFFWSRVAHAAVYIAGITVVRTIVFFAGTVGELMILAQLLR